MTELEKNRAGKSMTPAIRNFGDCKIRPRT